MTEQNCKKCDKPTICDEEAVAITCSLCSMIGVIDSLGEFSDEEIEALSNSDIVGMA